MDAQPSNPPAPNAVTEAGSGMVQRGLILLALMIVLLVGGYFLLIHQSSPAPPPALIAPEPLIASLASPQASFPATISFAALPTLLANLPSSPGWSVRYNAVASQARRGEQEVGWSVV